VAAAGARIYNSARRAELLSAPARHDDRAPVLYLRRFSDDETAANPGTDAGPLHMAAFRTEEEELAAVLNEIGPSTALGRPGEQLPQLGVAREYVADADWQSRVDSLMRAARLVVIRMGRSENVTWELANARRALQPNQLVLLVPEDEDSVKAAREFCENVLQKPILDKIPWFAPATTSTRALIYFADDWAPSVVPMRTPFLRFSLSDPARPIYKYAFEPVFGRLNVSWQEPPVSPAVYAPVIAVVVFMLIAFVLI
jgi:hypothetical protein